MVYEVFVWEKTPGMEWGDLSERGISEYKTLADIPKWLLNTDKYALVIHFNGKIIRDDLK